MSETSRPVSAWAPLGQSLFRSLWIASVSANIGAWMEDVGEAWLMTSQTPSPLLVALLQTAESLPIFLLALPAGALADIVDRRRLLLFTQIWLCLAATGLGVLTVLELTTPSVLLVFAFLVGIATALNVPAWQAITQELVPREQLSAAAALGAVGFNMVSASNLLQARHDLGLSGTSQKKPPNAHPKICGITFGGAVTSECRQQMRMQSCPHHEVPGREAQSVQVGCRLIPWGFGGFH